MSSNEPHGADGAEYLEQGSGSLLPPDTDRPSRKKLLVGGAAAGGLVLAGAGAWAAMSFLSQGAQPAEALPATTLGYVAVDLDPAGGQKVEAMQILKKFPALEEEVGLDTDDDLRKAVFDESGLSDSCPDLSYADDVEPWLGNRFAVAAVDLGEDEPAPVVVVQVQDAAAAEDGMAGLAECAGGDAAGWVVEGDWMVVAETESIAQDVVSATEDGTLADDSDYQQWTDEVGDAGVVNAFAAPEAGPFLLDSFDDVFGVGSEGGAMPLPTPTLPEDVRGALEDFGGAAATLRFSDGALELEVVADSALTQEGAPVSEGGDDVLSTLPADTAAAFGVGFTDGWFATMLDQMSAYSPGMDPERMLAQLEAQSGLDLPDDVETLLGDSAAVAISSDIDPDALVNSDTPEGLPIGIKVQGDAGDIESVLDKLRTRMGPSGDLVLSDSSGDTVAVSPSEDYLAELLEDGDLGDSDTFQNVVREPEAAGTILFVDFDAGDGWLVRAFEDDQTAVENLEPLEGLGMSSWLDGDVGHGVLRLTTD